MIVYHVCSIKKFLTYLRTGYILPPVRAWVDIKEAERFSKQTGRQIILRLKFPDNKVKRLEGHKGKAVYIEYPFPIKKYFRIEHMEIRIRVRKPSSGAPSTK